MLVQVAVKRSAQASLQSLDFPISWESSIAQQLSPAAAAKALGAISCCCDGGLCHVEISNGESAKGEAVGNADKHHTEPGGSAPAAADAAPADVDELELTETETKLQQELHGAGVVVGFRLWQLFRRLLRDKELMKACALSDST